MKMSGYGEEGRVFNSNWVYGVWSQLSYLHRRPFHIVFIQSLSEVKGHIDRKLKVTERNHPVASLEYTHLDIHDVVLGHRFKLTFIFVTRVFWKSNRRNGLNIVFFFSRFDRIRISVGCRSGCGERGGW